MGDDESQKPAIFGMDLFNYEIGGGLDNGREVWIDRIGLCSEGVRAQWISGVGGSRVPTPGSSRGLWPENGPTMID